MINSQASNHTQTYPAKLYFTPETMGDSCIRWIASDSQDRCWLSTNYNPRPQRWERRRYQVSEAWPMISLMNSTRHLAERPKKSSESQILCSNGSWCLLVSNCSENNSTTNIRITLAHLQANELGVEAPKTNSAVLTTLVPEIQEAHEANKAESQ